jgi:hypothetical protein
MEKQKELKNFQDFINDPQALIGQLVCYYSGLSHSKSLSRSICKIIKVGPGFGGWFSIENNDKKFSIIDGWEKMSRDRSSWGSVSYCKLITENEAEELRMEFARNKYMNAMRNTLTDKLNLLTYEQLIEIEKIINN